MPVSGGKLHVSMLGSFTFQFVLAGGPNPFSPIQVELQTYAVSATLPLRMASPQPTALTPNGSKFKFFTRSRGRSPASHKREPPPELSLGPPRSQGRWEAESDGDFQEFHSHETLDLSTPLSSVRTAPPTLLHAPSPLYPLYPQTATHTAQFLMPSPSPQPRQQLQHPFSANYEGRSQESDRDDASRSLRRARDTNRRRAIRGLHARDQHNGRIPSPFRGRSPDSRETGGAPSPATPSPSGRGSPQAFTDDTVTGEEVDLDVYPWFIFLHGESEVRIDPKRTKGQEGQGFSFISLR